MRMERTSHLSIAHTQQVCSPPDSPFPVALGPAAAARAVTTFVWQGGSAFDPTSLLASGSGVERPYEVLAVPSTVSPHNIIGQIHMSLWLHTTRKLSGIFFLYTSSRATLVRIYAPEAQCPEYPEIPSVKVRSLQPQRGLFSFRRRLHVPSNPLHVPSKFH